MTKAISCVMAANGADIKNAAAVGDDCIALHDRTPTSSFTKFQLMIALVNIGKENQSVNQSISRAQWC